MPDPHDKPGMVVVSGYPATGKTSLAVHLSTELRFPLVSKDLVKERLFDVMGAGDNDWSHLLGRASMAVLYAQAGAILASGNGVVAEANFDGELATRDLMKLIRDHQVPVCQVVLQADPDALIARAKDRAAAGERHPGHNEQFVIAELERMVAKPYVAPDLPGPCFSVDVTDLDAVDLDEVLSRVRTALASGRPSC
ncbi:MAG: ATP-binding protein [Actinobacteria bacterium]|nr:ATP-binding protein [Actinomycetota bacterium]